MVLWQSEQNISAPIPHHQYNQLSRACFNYNILYSLSIMETSERNSV